MNISEIARLAGVSSAAVSRYFNNGYISGEKREAIRKVVEETGYRPLEQARMLRTRKSMHIGVMVPKVSSSSMGRVIDGILSVLDESRYRMLLALTRNDPLKELAYLKTFDEGQVDGIIFIATIFTKEHMQVLSNLSVPVVIVGQKLDGYCSIYHDDYHAMYDMTRYVIDQGRCQPAYIGVTTEDIAAGMQRLSGYQDAVRDAGLAQYTGHQLTSLFSVRSGYEKAKELLAQFPDTDSIICATDEIAVGALKYLREMNISVPERILLSGLGDSDLAEAAGEGVMTIHYQFEESGKLAASALLAMLEGEEPAADTFKLGYTLL